MAHHTSSALLLVLFGLYALLGMGGAGFADTNVAPRSRVSSTPYVGAAISYLTDGKVATPDDKSLMLAAPLPVKIGQAMPLQYEFTFPRRLRVTGVRLLQHKTRGGKPAAGYFIELDTRGDGRYDKTIVAEDEGMDGEWAAYPVSPPVVAYGLRFRTGRFNDSAGANHGAPAIEEFEIFTDSDLPAKSAVLLPEAALLTEDVASAKGIKLEVPSSTALGKARFQRGMFGSMWLYWTARKKYSEQANYRHIALLQKLKINRYWLYPGVYVLNKKDLPYLTLPENPDYLYFIDRLIEHGIRLRSKEMRILPFPSAIVPGYKENVLGQFIAQMHKNGIAVIANESLLPYGLHGWDFPRIMNPKIYPCVLSSSFVRDASIMLYKEFMEAGVDGIALGGDEFFLYGHSGMDEDLSAVCRNADGSTKDICKPTCRRLFKQRFGVDHDPARERFSPLAAKWKIFEYEQLAKLFANQAQMMKSVNPDAAVTSLFRAGEEDRPAYGVAYDIMGSVGMISEMSSNPYWSNNSYLGHYYFANETKKLIGASRERTAVITLQATPNFDKNGYRDPIMVYGPAFSSLMHGARGINFYKQDYLFAGGQNDAGPWVEKFFNLTAFLEQKGLLDYDVPKTVALLYSRASDDWWQFAHSANAAEAAEAILYQNAVMEVLFKNGIPFNLYFLDQASSLEDMGKYSMAILAYPYAIGKEAVTKIRQAIGQGTKVVALRRKGEVDEFGERYQSPILDGLPGIEHLAIQLAQSSYADFSARLMPVVLKNLAGRQPLVLNSNGKDVECSVLSNGNSHLLFCLNWERQGVDINLGLHLVDGTYTVSVITLEHESSTSINGRSRLARSDLESFRLALAPGEAKILLVVPYSH